jgi:hypothetical protein
MGERLDVIDELERRLIDSCYGARRRPAWTSRPRAWIPAVGLAAAAAVVIAVLLAVLPGGEVSPSPALAALNSAARAAATTPSTTLGPGKEWYVQIVVTDSFAALTPPPTSASGFLNGAAISGRSVREVWMTRDGATTVRTTTRTVVGGELEGDSRPSTQRTAGHGTLSSPLLPVPLFSYRRLRALPADGAGLLKVLTRVQARLRARALRAQRQAQTQTQTTPATTTTRHNGKVSYAITGTGTVVASCCGTTPVQHSAFAKLNVIAWLLALPVSPKVRAALYRTAASLPGVRYDGIAHDALGRRGVEISVGSGGGRMLMIFDQHTGQLLASSIAFANSGPTAGFGPTVETLAVAKVVRTRRQH